MFELNNNMKKIWRERRKWKDEKLRRKFKTSIKNMLNNSSSQIINIEN